MLSCRLLFGLHAPILKPDFDLSLRQAKGVGDFDATPPRQVAIKVKFFLQFKSLIARVSLASSLRVRHYIYNRNRKINFFIIKLEMGNCLLVLIETPNRNRFVF